MSECENCGERVCPAGYGCKDGRRCPLCHCAIRSKVNWREFPSD